MLITQTYELSFRPFTSAAVQRLPNFTLATLPPAQFVNKTNKDNIDNIFMIKICIKNLCFDWRKLVKKKGSKLYCFYNRNCLFWFVKLKKKNNKVAIIMGSQSDYHVMKDCENILKILKIKYQALIVSAHRTPKRMIKFAENAEKNGFSVIVAGAGGAAHLAGMVASLTTLPVLGVPMETKKLKGLDSLLSMAQMPKGVPIGCLAIDGAFNAGVLAASIIANYDKKIKTNLEKWRRLQTQSIKKKPK